MEEVFIVARGMSGEDWIQDDPIIEAITESEETAREVFEKVFKEYAQPDTGNCEVERDEDINDLPWVDITCDEEDYHCFIKIEKHKIIRKNGLQK